MTFFGKIPVFSFLILILVGLNILLPAPCLAKMLNAPDASKQYKSEAFGRPGIRPHWSDARKVDAATYFEDTATKKSLLWFTAANGVLTEVFYPTIDHGQIKDSQILVSDGSSFFLQERQDFSHGVIANGPASNILKNVHAKSGLEISHQFFSLKDSPTLIDEVTINSPRDGLSFYLLTNPHLDNTGYYDSAELSSTGFMVSEGETQLSIESSVGFSKRSVGFVGHSDGYQDLSRDFNMDYFFEQAMNGNVATLGELSLPKQKGLYKFYVVYRFGRPPQPLQALKSNYDQEKLEFSSSWESYLARLKVPDGLSQLERNLYLRSLVILKSHEDKLNPGALIASLSIPWGEEQFEYQGQKIGGYHLIWPRDLYHGALALLLAGDLDTPYRALQFLKKIQYQAVDGVWKYSPRDIPKLGAFPQNTWVTGEEYWQGLQIDQVGYPIHLFYQLLRQKDAGQRALLLLEFQDMLKKALVFIQKFGPWTAQERWEENFGISPSSFSVAASALFLGAKIFSGSEFGDSLYKTAMGWMYTPGDNIDTWTYTTSGVYGDGHYYLRIAGCQNYIAVWDPENEESCHIANSGNRIKPSQFLDQGFLKLALLGLKKGSDEKILSSLDIVNENIRVQTPHGYAWYRYSFDAYGENAKGRLWPLLSGEQGRFAVERYRAGNLSWEQASQKVDQVLASFVGFANDGLLLPEQVYEDSGEGTGGATPLAWSHAEYIKLLWAKQMRRNPENMLDGLFHF